MKKTAKDAFGIYQDGQIIRMVHLRKDGAETYLIGVDSLSLERDWYKGDQAGSSIAESGFIPVEESYLDANDLDMDMSISMDDLDIQSPISMDSSFSGPRIEMSPTTKMYAKFPLHQGVIALNIHEEHILKDKPGLISKKDLKAFRKSVLSPSQIKAAQWHSCVINGEGDTRHWLHTGPNLLLESLQEYAKDANAKLFYKLADANDLALTDYYLFTQAFEGSGTHLLAYLGREYRKIFVFQNGEWTATLPIHISQDYPETDVIFSKIALALDSAQVGETESIALAGDLANLQLVNYINSQNVSMNARLLSFSNLTVTHSQETEKDGSEDQLLSPYTLALALAYKALNKDNPAFRKCSFLAIKVLDNQKELRVVWHGFIVLTLIFGLVLYTTTSFLGKAQKLRQTEQDNAELNFVLNRLRAENAIIETLTAEINRNKESMRMVTTLLEGKNPWTETFDRINTAFARYPKSWITNMKQSNGRIGITGITAKREHVSRIAEGLPDSSIRRVSHSKIKDQTVWNFELDFAFPEVNWDHLLASEAAANMESESTESVSTETVSPAYRSKPKTQPQKAPQEKVTSTVNTYGRLPEILSIYTPVPDEEELAQNKEFARTFQTFMESINRGNMLEYRFIAYAMIKKYPQSSHLSLTRWWLAHRLYQEKEYTLAEEYLNPNLSQFDRYHPDALLLKARLSYARSKTDYKQYYETLQNEYPRSKAAAQAAMDQKYIQGGNR